MTEPSFDLNILQPKELLPLGRDLPSENPWDYICYTDVKNFNASRIMLPKAAILEFIRFNEENGDSTNYWGFVIPEYNISFDAKIRMTLIEKGADQKPVMMYYTTIPKRFARPPLGVTTRLYFSKFNSESMIDIVVTREKKWRAETVPVKEKFVPKTEKEIQNEIREDDGIYDHLLTEGNTIDDYIKNLEKEMEKPKATDSVEL